MHWLGIQAEPLPIFVTEFWKITLMGVPETIRIFKFTMVLLTAEGTIQIFSQFILVIQSIFSILEP